MDNGVGLVAILIAVVALIVAVTALAMLMRARAIAPGDPLSQARQAEFERRLSQLGHRLEVVERDVDGSRPSVGAEGASAMGAVRHSGAGLSRIGLVRFDAFEDAGGGQSFALALIDDEGTGIVLTSLHSRQTTRMYVKDIRGGVADAPLSGEEERALRGAGVIS